MQNAKDAKWAKNLSHYQFLDNHRFHSSTKMTPHEYYFENSSDLTKAAKLASDEAVKHMINRSLPQHHPTQHNVGETVLVCIPRKPSRGVVRSGYSLRHRVCSEGKIIVVDRRRLRYKIEVKNNYHGVEFHWLSVADITSLTHDREN